MLNQRLPPQERIFAGSKIKLLVLSREEIKTFSAQIPFIVISITDPEKEDAEIYPSQNLHAVLRLKFHDVAGTNNLELKNFQPSNETAMNKNQALEILKFVLENLNGCELIVCQCEMGVSRSAAIAAALSKILNNEDEYFFKNYWANRWVYNLILENADVLRD